MSKLDLVVMIELENIIHELSFCDHDIVINFIKDLDVQVSDWQFTEKLYHYFSEVMDGKRDYFD